MNKTSKLNLMGQRFGKLVVIAPHENVNGRTAWVCKCDCGNECVVITKRLRNGMTKSCGCYKKQRIIESHRIDEVGNKYGKLTVVSYAYTRNNDVWWHCKCDCGNECDVMAYALRSGHTKSCGCLKEQSMGSYLIEKYLIEHNIKYKKEYTFDDLYGNKINCKYRFDFGILDDNNNLLSLIEFDGKQHFLEGKSPRFTEENIKLNQERDQKKNDYCKQHQIKLLRIKYTEEDKIETILNTWFDIKD